MAVCLWAVWCVNVSACCFLYFRSSLLSEQQKQLLLEQQQQQQQLQQFLTSQNFTPVMTLLHTYNFPFSFEREQKQLYLSLYLHVYILWLYFMLILFGLRRHTLVRWARNVNIHRNDLIQLISAGGGGD